jgi:hypothetical protein
LLAIERAGAQVHCRFRDVGDGLRAIQEPLGRFALRQGDGPLVWAEATITAPDIVTLHSDQVPQPDYVQFNFDNNPPKVLVSSYDLPVIPFRAQIP